jgi:hypothetical protein
MIQAKRPQYNVQRNRREVEVVPRSPQELVAWGPWSASAS